MSIVDIRAALEITDAVRARKSPFETSLGVLVYDEGPDLSRAQAVWDAAYWIAIEKTAELRLHNSDQANDIALDMVVREHGQRPISRKQWLDLRLHFEVRDDLCRKAEDRLRCDPRRRADRGWLVRNGHAGARLA